MIRQGICIIAYMWHYVYIIACMLINNSCHWHLFAACMYISSHISASADACGFISDRNSRLLLCAPTAIEMPQATCELIKCNHCHKKALNLQAFFFQLQKLFSLCLFRTIYMHLGYGGACWMWKRSTKAIWRPQSLRLQKKISVRLPTMCSREIYWSVGVNCF